MYDVISQDKWLLFSDGRDVVHMLHNTVDNQTTSGQPFMLCTDTEEALIALFYQTYTKDVDGNVTVAIPYPIKWNARFDSIERASLICDLINQASGGIVQVQSIKHPTRDEWATPFQENVVAAIPEGELKNTLLNNLQGSIAAGYLLTREQMEEEGWF